MPVTVTEVIAMTAQRDRPTSCWIHLVQCCENAGYIVECEEVGAFWEYEFERKDRECVRLRNEAAFIDTHVNIKTQGWVRMRMRRGKSPLDTYLNVKGQCQLGEEIRLSGHVSECKETVF